MLTSQKIIDAINEHRGEAVQVIENFKGISILNPSNNLTGIERQNLVYFLRSL